MRLVIISDTHRREPELPDGDVLIHCGDLTYRGDVDESVKQLEWLSVQPHKWKLVVAGNHELGWQSDDVRQWLFAGFPRLINLHNNRISIEGVKFWGSPVQPNFHGWAFQKSRGQELSQHWAQIPGDTDVLITHGPPAGFGDCNQFDTRFGDKDLLARVRIVRPLIHCYGHAHHGYGQWDSEGTKFINAAVLNEEYQLQNAPVEVEVNARQH
jgi:Icc-related predicted phosphoesterase